MQTRIHYIYKGLHGTALLRLVASTLLILAMTARVSAQDDVEYRMEIGGGVSLTSYQGDFNGGLFSGMRPGGAIVFRAIMNPHMAVRISGMYTSIKGSTSDITTVYPDLMFDGYSFNNSLADLSVTYEYNFWPYGTGREYRGAKRLTPFISLGLGMTFAHCKYGTWDYSLPEPYSTTKGIVTANIPLGVGVKYKIASRLNLSFDWQMHFSLSDKLDGVKDPYRIASNGLFKNTDCYSTLSLSLTYSFSPKCPTCQKER